MIETIYLAGGCFWGVEAYFQRIDGVVKTEVGYANGNTKNPTYEEVCTKQTGHAETVKIKYDTDKISSEQLLKEFYSVIDPFSVNRQGNDIGIQYRSGIYYTNNNQKEIIESFLKKQENSESIAIEVEPIKNFYPAESYHQKYLDKNPNGYCHIRLPD